MKSQVFTVNLLFIRHMPEVLREKEEKFMIFALKLIIHGWRRHTHKHIQRQTYAGKLKWKGLGITLVIQG